MEPTSEQLRVLTSTKKNLVVNASAGSGKTWVMVEFIKNLIIKRHVPIRRLLVLTFTRAGAGEIKERLNKALLEQAQTDPSVFDQLDDLSIADVSTIDSFCEKLLRRNLDKIDLDEGFRLVENPEEYKRKAFENALLLLSEQARNEIELSYRRNHDTIFKVVREMENFFLVEPDECMIERLENSQQEIFDRAKAFLNEDLIARGNRLKKSLTKLGQQFDEEKYAKHCQVLSGLFDFGDDFVKNVEKIQNFDLPSKPTKSKEGGMLDDELKLLHEAVKTFKNSFNRYNFDEKLLDKQRQGTLVLCLYELYKIYRECYTKIKSDLDVIDFSDVEAKAKTLLEDDDVLLSLQDNYDYIFVDEYQDTNYLQESLIKPIASKGHFIAVGDPKQGIYGFRNATMEIIQKDSKQFSLEEDGGVEYLRGNFRSDKRILDFVNAVFEPIMREDTVGIDYKTTSKLVGYGEFEPDGLPAVQVDIVQAEKREKEGISEVYSVKNAPLYVDKEGLEVETIVARIDQLLLQKIYDVKSKTFRKVEFDDIAVLFRSRSAGMSTLADALSRRGYPVISDAKTLDIEEPEVQMLVNLLRLLECKDNDIALISVMASQLGGFSLDDLAEMRLNFKGSIYEMVCTNEKTKGFLDDLDNLKLEITAKGLNRAVIAFLVKKDYFAYLKRQLRGDDKLKHVYNFLQELKNFDNVSSAISYFDNVGGKQRTGSFGGGNAIKLMTIHASKGLEYPIVILAGAGNDIKKAQTNPFALNGEFGLGTKVYDLERNISSSSPVLEAIKLQNRKKEMIDELMIFYVALTRAKNHLYIIGVEPNKIEYNEFYDLFNAKNYFELIFYSLGKNLFEKIKKEGEIKNNFQFNYINSVVTPNENVLVGKTPFMNREEIEGYLDFEYKDKKSCKMNLKNSVTALNLENKIKEKIIGAVDKRAVDIGNAYHEALKILDFSKITSEEKLNEEININKNLFTPDYPDLIDRKILYKDIELIKSLGDGRYFKEKEFVMLLKLNELAPDLNNDEVLVQGVCDLFIIGEKNILIDYKYTQEKNPQKILERYSRQLDLYSKAIERAFGITLDKKYILSLKNTQLIEYFS